MIRQMYDVVIPTFKPDGKLNRLIEGLKCQRNQPNRIILLNTESNVSVRGIEEKYDVEIYTIKKDEFDHGGTRDFGMRLSQAPYVLLMTQDAVPTDEILSEELLKPFVDTAVAVSFARQLPIEDTDIIERYTRLFNYPDKSRIKSMSDIDELGIKTFFCSNVCAMYNREIYIKNNGFVRKTIFNEDMIYAGKVIRVGYKVAYQAEAKVIHAHNYSGREQLKRNFDMAVSQVDYPEAFAGIKAESEGVKLVRRTANYLFRNHKYKEIVVLIYKSGCKYLGYLLGTKYKRLPRWLVRRITMNQAFWRSKLGDS
ncbi:glycosyltransferase family 2 protein [Ohessyouella blattaphilus]|uniref:Glycosyltransferase n=1 Tax=Ohessyouella blattaphilus TaxID=2949333 RepID=A0ABT1ED81_9FIRM|nr:glycosyltransferase [Ohessyouella blattaphilus]MCP1108656.1 glycosyltransferase [Ohessyouella blattaphilus]MCR8562050.1 glycosyltransferase [Ohessyouella blattaphilus]